jgi:hypothetical protein
MLTAEDLQRVLVNYLGGQVDDQAVEDVRLAIRMGMDEVAKEHEWPYYLNHNNFTLDAPYSTGTVAFVYATRTLTLTGGTWPTWAVYGTVRIAGKEARVKTRQSNTVLILEDDSELLDDVDAGTSFAIGRGEYPLPGRFLKMTRIFFDDRKSTADYRSAADFQRNRRPTITRTAFPAVYTVKEDKNVPGGLVVEVWPAPSRAMSATYSALRYPDEIAVWEEYAGRITVVGAAVGIAGTGTAFTSQHEGAVLRIARDQERPSHADGNNPFAEEVLIDTVTDDDTATAKTAFAASRGPVKYIISSRIDLHEPTMRSVLVHRCYFELTRIRKLEAKIIEGAAASYNLALSDAKSAAKPSRATSYAGNFGKRPQSLVFFVLQ